MESPVPQAEDQVPIVFHAKENKSGRDSQIESSNQALRDSAPIVLASRQLLQRRGRRTEPGIDEATYIYAVLKLPQTPRSPYRLYLGQKGNIKRVVLYGFFESLLLYPG